MLKQVRQDLSILLIDDEQLFREQVTSLLGVYNEVKEASSIREARPVIEKESFDVILLDKKLADGSGLDLIPIIKAHQKVCVIIVLTADSNLNLIQKCLDAGASDYLLKSPNIISDLLIRIPLAIRNLSHQRRSDQLETRLKSSFKYEIVGRSAAMNDLRNTIQSLKGTLSPILITGESGTGKELIARRLNAIEDRNRPYVALNCGAIPENLIESELFGHVRGAFSGAIQDQAGKFELADGGDLFLDEIGELPAASQVKLLRVLQEGEFTPLGSKKLVHVSVRVIAATNRKLEELVSKKEFREDLYYRLNVFRINTVPLRQCREDISELVQYFIIQMAGSKSSISKDACDRFVNHGWPGNIRELRNAVERALFSMRKRGSNQIELSDVRLDDPCQKSREGLENFLPESLIELSGKHYQNYMESAERTYIQRALEICDENASEAANRMAIGRSTLFRRMSELGISRRSPGLTTRAIGNTPSENEKAYE